VVYFPSYSDRRVDRVVAAAALVLLSLCDILFVVRAEQIITTSWVVVLIPFWLLMILFISVYTIYLLYLAKEIV
jgi:hypothetical protein